VFAPPPDTTQDLIAGDSLADFGEGLSRALSL
jgi:hypothetical protein